MTDRLEETFAKAYKEFDESKITGPILPALFAHLAEAVRREHCTRKHCFLRHTKFEEQESNPTPKKTVWWECEYCGQPKADEEVK